MTELTTGTITPSVFDWQETTVEKLQIGSRFRFIKEEYSCDALFVALEISEKYDRITVFSTEWTISGAVETAYQTIASSKSDTVLVTPFHEQSIALNGSKS